MTTAYAGKRAGWRAEEEQALMEAVRRASDHGEPLRVAFERVGERLGRKPDSIRNYYYLRAREAPEVCARVKTPFRTFSPDEAEALSENVLRLRAEGLSVRAAVHRLAGGDRRLALRYQNKFRSLLRARPEVLRRTAERLRAEGVDCPDALFSESRIYGEGGKRGRGKARGTGSTGAGTTDMDSTGTERADRKSAPAVETVKPAMSGVVEPETARALLPDPVHTDKRSAPTAEADRSEPVNVSETARDPDVRMVLNGLSGLVARVQEAEAARVAGGNALLTKLDRLRVAHDLLRIRVEDDRRVVEDALIPFLRAAREFTTAEGGDRTARADAFSRAADRWLAPLEAWTARGDAAPHSTPR